MNLGYFQYKYLSTGNLEIPVQCLSTTILSHSKSKESVDQSSMLTSKNNDFNGILTHLDYNPEIGSIKLRAYDFVTLSCFSFKWIIMLQKIPNFDH